MVDKAFLLLEDGAIYNGRSFGRLGTTFGEVVFNTSMYGYQEMLTDPSYAGQILVLTYPMIGNYGINSSDSESRQIQVRGLIVRQHCPAPSHTMSETTLDGHLENNGVPGLSDIDTRSLVRRLRSKGVMMGILTSEMSPEEAMEELRRLPRFDSMNFAQQVSTAAPYNWSPAAEGAAYKIAIIDCGLKYNIPRILTRLGCRCAIFPYDTPAEVILAADADGILLSPGPGDPAVLQGLERNVAAILGRKPVMGICLGHQLIARALGADTFKLKFGHRGGNHPVMDIETGRVYMTAQNHGYAVDAEGLPSGLIVNQINYHDHTVEGLRHASMPILSIQYHAEGSPGPMDNMYLFDRFIEMIADFSGKAVAATSKMNSSG